MSQFSHCMPGANTPGTVSAQEILASQLFPLFLPGSLTLWPLGSGGRSTLPPKVSRLTFLLQVSVPQLFSQLPVMSRYFPLGDSQFWKGLIRYFPEHGLF